MVVEVEFDYDFTGSTVDRSFQKRVEFTWKNRIVHIPIPLLPQISIRLRDVNFNTFVSDPMALNQLERQLRTIKVIIDRI